MDYYVIYENPTDYPGEWVVRRYTLGFYATAMGKPKRFLSLEDARGCIPQGLTCFKREVVDDPVIVETWL